MKWNIISRNVETYLVLAAKSITRMTQRPFYIIYFRRSSSTNPPPFREAQIANLVMLSRIEQTQQYEIIQSWLPWTKGLMLTPLWAQLALQILQWPILIWERVCLTRTTHMLSSRNCIETYYCVKVRILYKSFDMP